MRTGMKNLIVQYKKIILYLFFGVLTTLVNFIVYFIFQKILPISYQLNIFLAWVISVLFAFYTNKYFVFQNNTGQNKWLEMLRFYSSRILSLIVELVFMIILIEYLRQSEFFSKIFVQIIVIILNYILSTLFVFSSKMK